MVYTNNNLNNNINPQNSINNIFNRPLLILILFASLIFTVVYVMYYYFRKNQPISGFTYYSSDINNLNPLFNTSAIDINDCIDQCNKQPMCDGITFNTKPKACLGQYEGLLRSDTNQYISWIKDKKYNSLKSSGNIENTSQGESIVSLLKSTSRGIIANSKVPIPIFTDQFTFSFWITIKDWYHNYSYWRHIFHKGSSFDSTKNDFKIMQIHNWEEITDSLPEQCIGAWLTPFQNNIRIAVTTSSSKFGAAPALDANIEKCDCIPNLNTKKMDCSKCWITDLDSDPTAQNTDLLNIKQKRVEYIDIFDVETNKPINIVVSFSGISAEIYVNTKFKTTFILSGPPEWNNGDLYVHNPIEYKGEVRDIIVLPGTSSMKIVKDLYKKYEIK